MRVDFRADVDLAKLAYKKNSTVLAISLFCGTDNPDLSIGPPTVYLQGQPLLQGKWGQATQSKASSSPGSREYHFFFNVARRENFKSKPPQRGYDLRRNPEDMCFYLTGGKPGWFGFKFKSRVATILKSDIAEAFLGITTARCFSADQRSGSLPARGLECLEPVRVALAITSTEGGADHDDAGDHADVVHRSWCARARGFTLRGAHRARWGRGTLGKPNPFRTHRPDFCGPQCPRAGSDISTPLRRSGRLIVRQDATQMQGGRRILLLPVLPLVRLNSATSRADSTPSLH